MCPIDMFISANNPELLLAPICCCQSLGVCVCSDSWVGSDCSVPRDSSSLVWETLLDTQLTAVSAACHQESKNLVSVCRHAGLLLLW